MRRPPRPAAKKSSNAPLVIGAVVLVAGVGLVAMRGSGQPSRNHQSASTATPAPATERDVVAENRAKYAAGRHKEILLETYRGLIRYEDLAPDRVAWAEKVAAREYDDIRMILGHAELLGRRKGEVDTYRAAADLVWNVYKDMSRYADGPPSVEWVQRNLELAAEKVRVQASYR